MTYYPLDEPHYDAPPPSPAILHSLCKGRRQGCSRSMDKMLKGAKSTTLPFRHPLERSLELHERRGWLVHLQEQLAKEFAHGYEPVLHRNVLLASVLQVGSRTHDDNGLIVLSLSTCHPRGSRPALDLDLLYPVS